LIVAVISFGGGSGTARSAGQKDDEQLYVCGIMPWHAHQQTEPRF
jgi:uncharacterized protein involved in copper resistance